MKIMVFLHGTMIMHRAGIGRSRLDRVRQVRESEESVFDFAAYVPIGRSQQKVESWHAQGAEVVYLSSHLKSEDVKKDRSVLRKYEFPEGEIYFRQFQQSYAEVAEKVMPDILIEDDCESIGGVVEMTYPHIAAAKMKSIKHVVVREFEGIDRLPSDLAALADCAS